MQNISWILPEKPCWFDSTETEFSSECFIKGQILSLPNQTSKVQISYKSADNKLKSSEISSIKLFELNEYANPSGIDDMVNLACFNEPELLNNLKIRYKNDIIFTYIGPTLLIINPYKSLTVDFCLETIKEYKKYTLSTDKFLLQDKPPHIFANAGLAYRQLFEQNRNQAIVISGESGAGKTESVKYTMKFLAAISHKDHAKNQVQELCIEEKIVSCSIILEAFGNAKTIRNYNSSRFGKYVRIWFEEKTKKIKEADIINYLLEKSRVSMQSIGERNYHIFYHFLRGASQDLLNQYKLTKDLKYYDYLNKSGCYDADNIDDVELFKGVCECFEEMKFNSEEVSAIWSVLAAILKLGNLEFDDTKKTDTNPCKIVNEALFDEISDLLQIEMEILRSALIIKTRITDKEKFLCPLDKNECISVRDSFSKCLYDKVFNWIIHRLNISIKNRENNNDNKIMSIGLLDIFGFEDFKINSLEQFCINFTNEKLQQLYINYIFKSEHREFVEEGLESFIGLITFQDNQAIIDLFDKPPYGIFLLLDEATTLKSSEDKRLLETIVKTHKDNPCFKAPKSVFEIFIVVHSAKNVEYNITGFRRKNKDEINQEIEDAVTHSKNPNIYNIYVGECVTDKYKENMEESKDMSPNPFRIKKGTKSMGGVDKFLGTKFRTQMKQLMEELSSCDAHFIRCLKPNEMKKSDNFVPITVLSQIRYLGLLDSIKVRKNTYPARKEFYDFYKKYQEILKSKGCKDYSKEIKGKEYRHLCEEIVKIALEDKITSSEVLYGKTKIYLKGDIEDRIDRIFLKMWKSKQEKAKKIWKQYKIFKLRRGILKKLEVIYKRMKNFKRFQAICKGKIQRKRFLRKKKTVEMMVKIKKKMDLKVCKENFRKLHKICHEMKKWQSKKKASGRIYKLREKIMGKLTKQFYESFKKQCEIKKQCILERKRKEEEQKQLLLQKQKKDEEEKIKREEEILIKKQKDEEKRIILEKQKKEEEILKQNQKDEENRLLLQKKKKEKDEENRVLLEKQKKEEEIIEQKRKDEEKRLLLEKQKEQELQRKKQDDENLRKIQEEILEKKNEENKIILENKRKLDENMQKQKDQEEEIRTSVKKPKDTNDAQSKLAEELRLSMEKKQKTTEHSNKIIEEKQREDKQKLQNQKEEEDKLNDEDFKLRTCSESLPENEKFQPACKNQNPIVTNQVSFQDRIKLFNQPKNIKESPVKSPNNVNKPPIGKNDNVLLKVNEPQDNPSTDRNKVKSMASKFNQTSFASETHKNPQELINQNIKSQANILQKNPILENPKINNDKIKCNSSTLPENDDFKRPQDKPLFKSEVQAKSSSIKDKIEGFNKNQKVEEPMHKTKTEPMPIIKVTTTVLTNKTQDHLLKTKTEPMVTITTTAEPEKPEKEQNFNRPQDKTPFISSNIENKSAKISNSTPEKAKPPKTSSIQDKIEGFNKIKKEESLLKSPAAVKDQDQFTRPKDKTNFISSYTKTNTNTNNPGVENDNSFTRPKDKSTFASFQVSNSKEGLNLKKPEETTTNTLQAPVGTKISVKELSKNLSMFNLPFKNYPGNIEKPKPVIHENEKIPEGGEIIKNMEEVQEKRQTINDDFNDIMLERGSTNVAGKKKKAAKKVEDFDF